MKNKADVVIIGAGANGVSLAYYLAKLGMTNSVIVEKNYVGSGASGRNTAGIRAAWYTPELVEFLSEAIRLFEGLTDELDFNIMFRQSGYLFMAFNESEAELFKEAVDRHKTMNVDSKLIDPGEVKELAPEVDIHEITAGIWHPSAGIARHDAVVWGYAKRAREMGIEIYPFTEVKAIRMQDGEVKSVLTNRGEIEARYVVNAAGGWSRDIAKMVGIDMPNKPYRREALVTEPIKPFMDPMFITLSKMVYGNQTDRGEVVVGSEDPKEGWSYNQKSTLDFLERVARGMISIFPRLKMVRVLRQWGGLYDLTPDFCPELGEVEGVKGFILDCGWFLGWMASPVAGKLLADLIVEGKKHPLVHSFRFSRFQEGKLLELDKMIV